MPSASRMSGSRPEKRYAVQQKNMGVRNRFSCLPQRQGRRGPVRSPGDTRCLLPTIHLHQIDQTSGCDCQVIM